MMREMGETDETERRLVRALESAPQVAIPEEFAMRVASRVPAGAMPVREVSASNVGTRVALVVAALLLLAICALARSAAAEGPMWWLEIVLAVEFAALTAWLSLRPYLNF